MRGQLTGLNTFQKQFMDEFKKLTYSRNSWEVWGDFVTIVACSISNAADRSPKRDEREQMYLKIAGRYTKNERECFCRMLAVTVEALEENPEQDFLGVLFQRLELNSHWHGQFFTPYHVCEFMAKISLSENVKAEIEEKGYISVNDPACGAGALLIAAANAIRAAGANYQTSVEFVAQDIDFTAAMMCYIQLSLLGCPGYVIVGDSLAHPAIDPLPPDYEIWYTPFYYTDVWRWRRLFHSLERAENETPENRVSNQPETLQNSVKTLQKNENSLSSGFFVFFFFEEEKIQTCSQLHERTKNHD